MRILLPALRHGVLLLLLHWIDLLLGSCELTEILLLLKLLVLGLGLSVVLGLLMKHVKLVLRGGRELILLLLLLLLNDLLDWVLRRLGLYHLLRRLRLLRLIELRVYLQILLRLAVF